MSVPAQMQGLSLDQAPPLSVPAAFFVIAPASLVAVGAVLSTWGALPFSGQWHPISLGLTHLGTLGFLAMVMLGALYQMIPVVVGVPVPYARAAHAVHPLFVLGVASLAGGLMAGSAVLAWGAIVALGVSIAAFLLPVSWALARARAATDTVHGMRFAVLCLFLVALLGLWMAHGHAGSIFPGDRVLWVEVHFTVGILGWVGGLLMAVSFQVVPMFYLATEPSRRARRGMLVALAVGVLLPPLCLLAGSLSVLDPASTTSLATWSASPAVLAAWVLHPLSTLRGIAKRKRRRSDGSLHFWRAGMALGPVVAAVALVAVLSDEPRWNVALAWLAIFGWAGMVVHGMLTRIVPFLVWFHRFSALAGRVPIPSMRGLLPDRWTRRGFVLHLSALVCGAAAVGTGWDWAARLTGALVILTGGSLGVSLVAVLRRRPDALAPQGPEPGSSSSSSTRDRS